MILYETANYKLTRMRVGSSLHSKIAGKEVYFQPGTGLDLEIAALNEDVEDQAKRDLLFDILCAEYF